MAPRLSDQIRQMQAAMRSGQPAGREPAIEDPTFLHLLDRLPLPVALVAATGQVVLVNKRATQAFGYTLEHVPDMATWRLRAYPDPAYRLTSVSRWELAVSRAVAQGVDVEPQEFTITTLWGDARQVTIFGLPVQGGFAAFFIDHTERDSSEARRLESEQRFRDVVNAAGEYVWECDTELRYTFLSDKVTDIFGYRPEEMVGQTPIAFMPPGEYDLVAGRLADLLRPDGTYRGLEHRSLTRDGQVFWQLVSGVPVRNSRGEVVAYRGTGRDISERKRADEERGRLEAQVREAQKMQAVGTLAGGIAHEFNNLLAVILGHAALAKRDADLAPRTRDSLLIIDEAAQDARQLVQQILAFGRRQPRDSQCIATPALVRDVLGLLQPSLPGGVTLHFEEGAGIPAVAGDPTQLKQVLLNLCINASHAMAGREGRIVVGLEPVSLGEEAGRIHRALQPGRYARITVADGGCGMDEVTLAHIFEPFFTTKPVGHGTGLGLSVVDGIVHTHGGAITVSSEPGIGSVFAVYLPAQEAGPAPTAEASPPAVAGAGNNCRILYVDDQEWLVPLVRRLLEEQGYAFSGYSDPQAALDAVRAEPGAFDVLVTDYRMPGMSGLELSGAVRALRPDAPIVLISGYTMEDVANLGDRGAIDAFVFKPSLVDELCPTLDRLLARSLAQAR